MKQYLEIIKTLDIDDFENAIGFEPNGRTDHGEDWGHCPDPWRMHRHGDRTGKFSINRDKKVFNCFVCGGGTLLSLTMAIRDCTEDQAIEWLWQFSSKANQTNEGFIDEIDKILSIPEKEETLSLPWFNQNVLTQWKGNNH